MKVAGPSPPLSTLPTVLSDQRHTPPLLLEETEEVELWSPMPKPDGTVPSCSATALPLSPFLCQVPRVLSARRSVV